MMAPDVAAQRAYYARTASTYDTIHDNEEMGIGLAPLIGYARLADARSILDVGSGTGRALRQLKSHLPQQVRIVGVEPSAELRAVGHERHGLAPDELIDGDALALPFQDGAFDIVCATAVLHHIRDHRRAVAEMMRVAGRAVFICDGNHLAHGALWRRVGKRWLRRLGLWPLANWVKTGGRGYWESEHEAPAYPYTVFADLPLLRRACAAVHVMNLSGDGAHAYRHAGSVAVLALKDR
jgi:ubiquinone/menaquinone biosynthesis C-methylase UbiE